MFMPKFPRCTLRGINVLKSIKNEVSTEKCTIVPKCAKGHFKNNSILQRTIHTTRVTYTDTELTELDFLNKRVDNNESFMVEDEFEFIDNKVEKTATTESDINMCVLAGVVEEPPVIISDEASFATVKVTCVFGAYSTTVTVYGKAQDYNGIPVPSYRQMIELNVGDNVITQGKIMKYRGKTQYHADRIDVVTN